MALIKSASVSLFNDVWSELDDTGTPTDTSAWSTSCQAAIKVTVLLPDAKTRSKQVKTRRENLEKMKRAQSNYGDELKWSATVKKQIEASQAEQKTDEIDQTTVLLPEQEHCFALLFPLTHICSQLARLVPNQEKEEENNFFSLCKFISSAMLCLLSCVNFNCFKVYQKEWTHSQEKPKLIFSGARELCRYI